MRRAISVKLKRRRNFLPTFLLALVFWLAWFWLVFSFPPSSNLLLVTFYLLLFIAVFLTSALIFANSKLGFLTACFAIAILLFRYYQIGNFLNLLILSGIFICLAICLR